MKLCTITPFALLSFPFGFCVKENYFAHQNDLIMEDQAEAEETRVLLTYDEYDESIEKADYNYHKKEDLAPLVKLNSVLGTIILLGIICLPMAIAAEININAISAQIADLSRLLTTYFTSLQARLNIIIIDLNTILADLLALTNQVNTNANTLQTIITLINNIRRRSLRDDADIFGADIIPIINPEVSSDKVIITDGGNKESGSSYWYISHTIPALSPSFDSVPKLRFINTTTANDYEMKMVEKCIGAALAKQFTTGFLCSIQHFDSP